MRVLEKAFVRGSAIVFIVFPDILARSPIFDRVRAAAAGKVFAAGLGRARAEKSAPARCALDAVALNANAYKEEEIKQYSKAI